MAQRRVFAHAFRLQFAKMLGVSHADGQFGQMQACWATRLSAIASCQCRRESTELHHAVDGITVDFMLRCSIWVEHVQNSFRGMKWPPNLDSLRRGISVVARIAKAKLRALVSEPSPPPEVSRLAGFHGFGDNPGPAAHVRATSRVVAGARWWSCCMAVARMRGSSPPIPDGPNAPIGCASC